MERILEAKRSGEKFAESSAFDLAVAQLRERVVLTKDQFEKLEEAFRKQSFTIAHVESTRLLERSKEILQEYLEQGKNIDNFWDDLDAVFDRAGVSALNPYHAETVFRNAQQSAYNEARFATMEASDAEEFPMYEVSVIDDDRLRPSHRRFKNFRARRDDPIWNRLRPPFGHGCRCTWGPVHVSEGLKPSKKTPNLQAPGLEFVGARVAN